MSFPYHHQPPQQHWHQQYDSYVTPYPQQEAHPLPSQPSFQIVIPPVPSYTNYTSSDFPQAMGFHPQSCVLQDVQPNVNPRAQVQAKTDLQSLEPTEELDYAILLLTLADEYFDTFNSFQGRSEESYKVYATALGCLESVLNNFRLSPLREAQVSLKYAQALYDATDNNDDAERILTRAIELCERNKFVDLKYAMHALLSRVLHRSRPKAAIKDLEKVIEDVEVFRHIAWEYSLRMLQASFLLLNASAHDLHLAISQYEKISAKARQNGDYAVFAFAAMMEALIHLQMSSPDAVGEAQRALAVARQLQLNPEVAENPQMQTIMDFVDLSCSLRENDLPQIEKKYKAMQGSLYQHFESPRWQEDGSISLPLSRRSINGLALQEGGLVSETGGKLFLTLRWMTKEDVETLGFLLSSASTSHKNGADGGKAEKFIHEGLDRVRSSSTGTKDLLFSETSYVWRRTLELHFMVEKAFLLCARGDWTSARQTMDIIGRLLLSLDKDLPTELRCIAHYLDGAIQQGTGNQSPALAIFRSSTFAPTPLKLTLEPAQKQPSRAASRYNDSNNETIRNISILAAMNVALIIHPRSHPQHNHLESLLTTLDPIIHTCSNKHIQASYSLLLAILSDSSVLKQKQFLGNALSTAQSIGNSQITALTLILMSEKFFRGMVGEQATKCAKAASHQARRAGDPLWIAVAGGMESECLDVHGMGHDAARYRAEADRVAKELPNGVRDGIVEQ